ncbi:MAG: carboxypeptidase-like regulatory domain-containing protein [Polyangiaceae bacterium]
MKFRLATSVWLSAALSACGAVSIGNDGASGGVAGTSGASSASGGAGHGGAASAGGASGASTTSGGSRAGGAASSAGATTGGVAVTSGGNVSAGGSIPSGSGGTAGADDGGAAGAATAGCGAAFSIEGKVTSPEGAPIAGAKLSLSGTSQAEALSDASGHYVFAELCAGAYAVDVSKAGLSFCDAHAENSFVDRDLREDFAGSAGGCDPAPFVRRPLVLIYDPYVTTGQNVRRKLSALLGYEDPTAVVKRLMRALRVASNGHVSYEVADLHVVDEFPTQRDGFRYTAATYLACVANPQSCHALEGIDLQSLDAQFQICSAVVASAFDEVWLVGAPHFGFATWSPLTLDPGCKRDVDVQGIPYEQGLVGALHAFQQRSYGVLGAALGVDADRVDAYGNTHVCACSEFDSDRFWLQNLPRTRGLDVQGHLGDWWRLSVRPDDCLASLTSPVTCSSSYNTGWCGKLLDGIVGECNDNEWATSSSGTGWAELYFSTPKTVQRVRLSDRVCGEQVLKGHLEFSDGSARVDFGALPNKGDVALELTFAPRQITELRVVIDESTGTNPGLSEVIVD